MKKIILVFAICVTLFVLTEQRVLPVPHHSPDCGCGCSGHGDPDSIRETRDLKKPEIPGPPVAVPTLGKKPFDPKKGKGKL